MKSQKKKNTGNSKVFRGVANLGLPDKPDHPQNGAHFTTVDSRDSVWGEVSRSGHLDKSPV